MTLKYSHTQKGGFWFYFFVIGFVFVLVLYLVALIYDNNPSNPEDNVVRLVIPFALLGFAWLTLLFSSLTVTIDDQYLRFIYGRFAFRKEYLLSDISGCQAVYNNLWWIGTRQDYRSKQVVELALCDGRKDRIWTDDPQGLADAIRDILGAQASRLQ